MIDAGTAVVDLYYDVVRMSHQLLAGSESGIKSCDHQTTSPFLRREEVLIKKEDDSEEEEEKEEEQEKNIKRKRRRWKRSAEEEEEERGSRKDSANTKTRNTEVQEVEKQQKVRVTC